MKVDAVFSGGGVKAHAFIGALKSIEQNNLKLERVAGTSAGAIIASFIAANYCSKEIEEIIKELDFEQFLDEPRWAHYIPFGKWFMLFFQMGIYKGDAFEKWVYNILAARNIYTFADFKPNYFKVIVSDLTLGKLVILPDDLERLYQINPNHFPVSRAVRMSAGFPYFFMPKKIKGYTNNKSLMVDGGLLSNFPLWVFRDRTDKRKRPVLGVKLSEIVQANQSKEINNAFQMFHALFSTMKTAHDARYIDKSDQNNIIFIPVDKINAVDFSIDEQTIDRLITTGKERADQFLKYWPT